MKKLSILSLVLAFIIIGCSEQTNKKAKIVGSWKLIYNQIKEADSIQIKDLSKTDFIKIINETHFSFTNQPKDSLGEFYSGAGTYSFDGKNYTETLQYIAYKPIRNHQFHFKIEFKGDTLIQYGKEKVEAANMDREIVEKYIKIK